MTPAEATAAKGMRRAMICFAAGESLRSRGTRAFKPRATEQEAETARR